MVFKCFHTHTAEQVDRCAVSASKNKQYRLPDGHWASTLEEVICSFGHSFRNELRCRSNVRWTFAFCKGKIWIFALERPLVTIWERHLLRWQIHRR